MNKEKQFIYIVEYEMEEIADNYFEIIVNRKINRGIRSALNDLGCRIFGEL